MTKYISKVVEIEAEKLVRVYNNAFTPEGSRTVETDTGRIHDVVSSQDVKEGDYLNVTDPEDIYHIPAKVMAAKYEEV